MAAKSKQLMPKCFCPSLLAKILLNEHGLIQRGLCLILNASLVIQFVVKLRKDEEFKNECDVCTKIFVAFAKGISDLQEIGLCEVRDYCQHLLTHAVGIGNVQTVKILVEEVGLSIDGEVEVVMEEEDDDDDDEIFHNFPLLVEDLDDNSDDNDEKEDEKVLEEKDAAKTTLMHLASESGHAEILKVLIDNGASVNALDQDGAIPLHLAAYHGRTEALKVLIEHGAQVNAKDNEQYTALHCAADEGQVEAMEILISNGADLDVVDEEYMTPLLTVSEQGLDKSAKILLSHGANFRARGKKQMTSLHLAARGGHEGIVSILLEYASQDDIDSLDEDNWTPLHSACLLGRCGIVDMLLQAGADPNVLNSANDSPLTYASANGSVSIVESLLEAGALVNFDARHSTTTAKHGLVSTMFYQPIHRAALQGHVKIAEILLERGADVNATVNFDTFVQTRAILGLRHETKMGHTDAHDDRIQNNLAGKCVTAMHMAVARGHTDVVKTLLENGAQVVFPKETECRSPLLDALGHPEIFKLLIETEAGKDSTLMWQLLGLAVKTGFTSVLQTLRDKGLDINLWRDDDGKTALQAAARRGNAGTIKELFDLGATLNVNQTDQKGFAALHYAAQFSYEATEALLSHHDIDVDLVTGDGQRMTSLMLAAHHVNVDIIHLLLKSGANSLAMDRDNWTALTHIIGGSPTSSLIGPRKRLSPETLFTDRQSHQEKQQRGFDALLEHDPTIATAGKGRNFPLNLAVAMEQEYMVDLLLKSGATARDNSYAIKCAATDKASMTITKILLSNGADPNQTVADRHNASLIHLALENKDVDMVKILLEGGADVVSFDDLLKSTLHYAADSGSLDLAQLVVQELNGKDKSAIKDKWLQKKSDIEKHPFDTLKEIKQEVLLFEEVVFGNGQAGLAVESFVNLPDILGWSALHYAAASGDIAMVNFLVENGAKVEMVDLQLYTPHMIAAMGGFIDCAQRLKDIHDRNVDGTKKLIHENLFSGLPVLKGLKPILEPNDLGKLESQLANYMKECKTMREIDTKTMSVLAKTFPKFNENVECKSWTPDSWRKDGFLSIPQLMGMILSKACFLNQAEQQGRKDSCPVQNIDCDQNNILRACEQGKCDQ